MSSEVGEDGMTDDERLGQLQQAVENVEHGAIAKTQANALVNIGRVLYRISTTALMRAMNRSQLCFAIRGPLATSLAPNDVPVIGTQVENKQAHRKRQQRCGNSLTRDDSATGDTPLIQCIGCPWPSHNVCSPRLTPAVGAAAVHTGRRGDRFLSKH